MRLINTNTLEFEEFLDESEVSYAILSHRWEKEEVTFQDVLSDSNVSKKAGYHKIRRFCAQASKNGITYAWVDTCCIDKRSSAELQEAINSMFRWYQNAAICYAYICDWDPSFHHFPKDSEWFRRGWTLQELIAPKKVEFFDSNWEPRGTRKELSRLLAGVTQIPEFILISENPMLSNYSVAEKMSWAHGRKTTRIEDRAYSLLGLFDVNMPMLYGEGKKAFFRLQEEILRKSKDQSILAWTGVQDSGDGVFADSPDDFPKESAQRQWCRRLAGKEWQTLSFRSRGAHSVTNEGIDVVLELLPWKPFIYLAVLNYNSLSMLGLGDQDQFMAEGIFVWQPNSEDGFVRIVDSGKDVFRGMVKRYCGSAYLQKTGSGLPTVRTTLLRDTGYLKEMFTKYCQRSLPSFHFQRHGHSISSLIPGQCGRVEVIGLPGYPLSHYVKRVLLGFDFLWSPVIVVETGEDAPGSTIMLHDNDDDDVSGKLLDEVTCMESRGWLLIGGTSLTASILPLPKGKLLWPFKLSSQASSTGMYQCEVHLDRIDEHTVRHLTIILSRENLELPWNVALYVTKHESSDPITGYTSVCRAVVDAEPPDIQEDPSFNMCLSPYEFI